jgi:hypothetical protein
VRVCWLVLLFTFSPFLVAVTPTASPHRRLVSEIEYGFLDDRLGGSDDFDKHC